MCPKPNTAESGPLDCVIGPIAGKRPYIACLLSLSDRYDVCIAYRILLQVQEPSYMIYISWLVGGEALQNLPIGNGMGKGTSNT